MSGFNAHNFALRGEPYPAVDETKAVDYLVGANGTLARSRRPGFLEVALPVGVNYQPLRGLRPLEPYVRLELPRVPARLLSVMLSVSRDVCRPAPTETLFYLSHGQLPERHDCVATAGGWNLEVPRQRATGEAVEPEETGAGTATDRALIEVHSHHGMPAEFSDGDDRDELGWFRVYAVMGRIFERPEVRARVTLFGHVCEWPASEFFELPDDLTDCLIRGDKADG